MGAHHCLWPSDTLAFLNQSAGMCRVLGLYAGWSGLLRFESLMCSGARKGNLPVRLAKRAASEQSSTAPTQDFEYVHDCGASLRGASENFMAPETVSISWTAKW